MSSATNTDEATCSKMTASGMPTAASPAATTSLSNDHCSISHQGGLGPVMEIREISSYCNSCIEPEKYYHHHGASASGRHSAVYPHPQVFYNPPPPPPPAAYPSSSAVPPDWNCPPPPSAADSFSHFIYPHHQYPPPTAPQHHPHHDFSNFLSIPTSCYETDIIMMGPPPPSTGSNCEPVPPPPLLTNSFMYHSITSFDDESHNRTTVKQRKVPSTDALSSTTNDDDSDEDLDDDDGVDDRQVISIEDDSSRESVGSSHSSQSTWCVLCKRPATLLLSSPSPSPSSHQCSSPQLDKILLENIDDDDLDISDGSGDIEIGGIEDEMIQTDYQNKITIARLAQLLHFPTHHFAPSTATQPSLDRVASLCSKCHKLVRMAESLDKQLNSVLSTLRGQKLSSEGRNAHMCTASTQTEPSNSSNDTVESLVSDPADHTGNSRCIWIASPSKSRQQQPPKENFPVDNGGPEKKTEPQREPPQTFLCHECGRGFNCGRNLGKHLRRHQRHQDQRSSIPWKVVACSREDCTATCSDNAALQVHMRVHNGDKPYFCGTCLKLFTTKSNLTAHVKLGTCQNQNPQTPPNSSESSGAATQRCCENCDITFHTGTEFQNHLKSPESCINLLRLRSKQFSCSLCDKSFLKASELRAHQVVHTRAKAYPCDICGLSFTTKGNQRVHQRTHSAQKRFKCSLCTKSFTRNQTLQVHVNNVHDSKNKPDDA